MLGYAALTAVVVVLVMLLFPARTASAPRLTVESYPAAAAALRAASKEDAVRFEDGWETVAASSGFSARILEAIRSEYGLVTLSDSYPHGIRMPKSERLKNAQDGGAYVLGFSNGSLRLLSSAGTYGAKLEGVPVSSARYGRFLAVLTAAQSGAAFLYMLEAKSGYLRIARKITAPFSASAAAASMLSAAENLGVFISVPEEGIYVYRSGVFAAIGRAFGADISLYRGGSCGIASIMKSRDVLVMQFFDMNGSRGVVGASGAVSASAQKSSSAPAAASKEAATSCGNALYIATSGMSFFSFASRAGSPAVIAAADSPEKQSEKQSEKTADKKSGGAQFVYSQGAAPLKISVLTGR